MLGEGKMVTGFEVAEEEAALVGQLSDSVRSRAS